ncbi:hypothetical protein QNM99_08405 [Pseudomonas sp. PCH446]
MFSDIGDSRQTEALRQELNTRALNDLHRAMAEIDALPLFRQPIDFSQWTVPAACRCAASGTVIRRP